MGVTRSAPQGAHYHEDVIYFLPKMGIKKGARALWYSELSLHQLGSRPTVFIPQWTTHPYILYEVCATRAAIHRTMQTINREPSWRWSISGSLFITSISSLFLLNIGGTFCCSNAN